LNGIGKLLRGLPLAVIVLILQCVAGGVLVYTVMPVVFRMFVRDVDYAVSVIPSLYQGIAPILLFLWVALAVVGVLSSRFWFRYCNRMSRKEIEDGVRRG
jgi:flagellar biosynthesis protein FlhB